MEALHRQHLDLQVNKVEQFLAREDSRSAGLPGQPAVNLRGGAIAPTGWSPQPPATCWQEDGAPAEKSSNAGGHARLPPRCKLSSSTLDLSGSSADAKPNALRESAWKRKTSKDGNDCNRVEDTLDSSDEHNENGRKMISENPKDSMRRGGTWTAMVSNLAIKEKFWSSSTKTLGHEGAGSRHWMYEAIHGWQFRALCSMVIVLNAICIGIRTHMRLGEVMRGQGNSAASWNVVENCFTGFFAVELVLRLLVDGKEFCIGEDWKWNLFDSFLVTQSFMDLLATKGTGLNLSFARLLRILRFARILRLIRVMRFFQSFRIMVYSILCSMVSLLWVLMLLFFIIYFFAVFFLHGITDDYSKTGLGTQDLLQQYFGSLPEAVLSLFAAICGGADWLDIMKPLRDIGAIFPLGFVLYVFFMIFGVMNVVVALFVDQAWEVSQRDRDATIARELSKQREYAANIARFFYEADTDKSGLLSWEEFQAHLDDDRVKAYFSTLELDVSQARALFTLFDVDETNEVGIEEFIGGCMRLKGLAKSVDVNMLLYENEQIMNKLSSFMELVCANLHDIQSVVTGLCQAMPGSPPPQKRLLKKNTRAKQTDAGFSKAMEAARVMRISRKMFDSEDLVDPSILDNM